MADDRLDYQELVREALRDVVRRCLEVVAEEGGLPGDHFFYVSFRSNFPGVRIPAFLRDSYPDEVTIILQHQFWDLEVDREAFSVSLNFNASRQRVTVPYEALTSFVDPTAEFGLRFGPSEPEEGTEVRGPRSIDRPVGVPNAAETAEPVGAPASGDGGKIAGVLPFDPSRRR
ncbi:MAG TPA: ClpXP protease specificity-enhancing factor SspB [Thermoanaerobaculia bacterium]|nr:ClpXP protease specificity-enhancing factor SspB [Thermoanaerobaculia bacterium]